VKGPVDDAPWPLGKPQNIPPQPESMRGRAEEMLRRLDALSEPYLRTCLVAESLRAVTWEEGAVLLAELLQTARTSPGGKAARLALTLALGDAELVPAQLASGLLREAQERGHAQVAALLAVRGAYGRLENRRLPPPPPGSPSRELTLGERRALARKPDRKSLEKLLLDPEPMVIRNLLPNPRLIEQDVLRIASRRPCRADVLSEIAGSPRWICRPSIQLALVLNPYNRTEISLRLVEILPRSSLRQVAQESAIDPLIREAAQRVLERS